MFQSTCATAKQVLECNTTNISRFYLVKMLLGNAGDSLTPHDLYKLHVTDKLKMDTLTSILTTHAATSTMCLRVIERLLALAPASIEEAGKDCEVLAAAETAVGCGTYTHGTKYHPVGVISLEKRYLCLAYIEAYYQAKFVDFVQYDALQVENYNLYVFHALFYRMPRLYKFLFERALQTTSQATKLCLLRAVVRTMVDANVQMVGALKREKDADSVADGFVHFCYGPLQCAPSPYPRIYAPVATFTQYVDAMEEMTTQKPVAVVRDFIIQLAAIFAVENATFDDVLLLGQMPDYKMSAPPEALRRNTR